jgi:Flp pilus assembly protein TadD
MDPANPDQSAPPLHAALSAQMDLLRAGRFEAAIAAGQACVRRWPREAAAWSALASVLFSARRPEEALAAWDGGLALAPNAAALLCGKGGVLQSLGRVGEAEALYRQALAVDSGAFEPAFSLALIAVEAGDWAAAETWAAPLRARYPDAANLRWLSARVALGRGDFADAAAQLGELLASGGLGPEQRADALLLLSEALDGLERFPEAFAAAVEGKGLQRRLFSERARGRESAVGRFERLARWFEAADPDAWSPAPGVAPAPRQPAGHVFLVGFPRSGTTLLEQSLAGHPQVAALEEAPTLAAAHAEFMGSPEGLQRLSTLSLDEAGHWRANYWAEVKAHGVDAAGRVFLDKAPAGTVDLPLVAKLFPEARILFAVRDPRDVVLSCLRNSFQLNAMTYAFTDLAETAACYGACMALAEIYRRVLPLDWRDVRHEALVSDFEVGLAEVCEFLGLAFDPAMADVAATAGRRAVRTPSAPQVRAGLSRQGFGRWRAYRDQLAPVLPTLTRWVERFGYEPG